MLGSFIKGWFIVRNYWRLWFSRSCFWVWSCCLFNRWGKCSLFRMCCWGSFSWWIGWGLCYCEVFRIVIWFVYWNQMINWWTIIEAWHFSLWVLKFPWHTNFPFFEVKKSFPQVDWSDICTTLKILYYFFSTPYLVNCSCWFFAYCSVTWLELLFCNWGPILFR